MTTETREELLMRMAKAVRDHLPREESNFVAVVALQQTDSFHAYLSTGCSNKYTPEEFAAFALSCAKRAAAPGGAS